MDDFKLRKLSGFEGVEGAVVLAIMDGVGLYKGQADGYEGNAFDQAKTPNLDRIFQSAPIFTKLKAHGKAVGLPTDSDMGNSEVGHNAIGAGRVFDQGAKLVNKQIASGEIFENEPYQQIIAYAKKNGGAVHLIGLLSDGNVHSHINQLFAILERLPADGVEKIRVHPLADGRDVDPVTYHIYIEQLEEKLASLNADALIASGGGRMKITMDRYEASWKMVERGWRTHVLGQGRAFRSAKEAIETYRKEKDGIIDQDLPGFVIVDDSEKPIGTIEDGDSVIFFNFRGDRAIEISRAFTEERFDKFDRERVPKVAYAGMMEYDGDLKIPPRFLVPPPAISRTVSEYLAKNEVSQFAISETQKYGHVTYFWNGNNSGQFNPKLEEWVEIPSDDIPFEQKPQMKAKEITDRMIEALESGRYRFLRLNFANGDMVGHTGDMAAAIQAMETVDAAIGRLEKAVEKAGGTLVVTADHGNCDQMLEINKKTGEIKTDEQGKPVKKTSHTLSPVPFLITGEKADELALNEAVGDMGLGNIAASLLFLLGYEPPEDYLPSIITAKR